LTATGIVELGYLGFEVKDVPAWEAFATKVLGLEVASRSGGETAFRLDGRRDRLFVTAGEADDLAVVGWRAASDEALAAIASRLRGAGVDVTEGAADALAARGVERLVRFRDPSGIPTEVFVGDRRGQAPFASRVVPAGFVADDEGLGHLVLNARDLHEARQFYCDVLGFRLSDRITCDVYGYAVDIFFLHVGPRHHSLALGAGLEKRIHHVMLEAREMDDVGLAFDRTLRAGLRIAQTLGRHPNDRMFSFYALTPSGFQFELGWGGRKVDDATWEPTTYHQISEWGHHPPEILAPRKRKAPEEAR
jgi:2,3-dihydroxybiphenyl 1,2-dioxygenase